jgi:TolB-like protein/Tfp pilus assembly protein PilF
MIALWERLRERKLVQWALAYLAGSWILLQVLALLADSFGWPGTVLRIVIVVLGVGLLAVLALAWFHGERGKQKFSAPELAIYAILCVLAGAGVMLVGSSEAETASSSENAATPLPKARTSLAVLPFADLSPNRDQEYFSDGITDELISTLSTIPGMRVASRTSSFQLKGKDLALRQIGDELQVGAVLEGSVRRDDDSLRITARLIDVAGGHTLWTDTYDRGAADVLTVQQQIARAIAAALKVRLGAGRTGGGSNPEAYDLYLKGMYEWRKRDIQRAIDYFRQAIALDSTSALAHAGLSRAYQFAYLSLPEFSIATSLQQADESARRALALDSTLAEAHSALGATLAYLHRDYAEAERRFRRSIALNPNDALSRTAFTEFLRFTGRAEEGIREGEMAISLDPFYFAAYYATGNNYAMAGRYAEAEAAYYHRPEAAGLTRNFRALIDHVYVPQGKLDEARSTLAARGGSQGNPLLAAYIEAAAGNKAEAKRSLATAVTRSNALPGRIAVVYAALGEPDSAFAWLDRWAAEPALNFITWPFDPGLAPLREDPRFDAFMRKMRFPRSASALPSTGS